MMFDIYVLMVKKGIRQKIAGSYTSLTLSERHLIRNTLQQTSIIVRETFKGEPEPLEKESHEFLGSKRDDRFSNPFFEMVPITCQGSFFVPALA